jgi:MFS family permease
LLSTAVVAIAYPVLGIVLPVLYEANDDPAGLGAVVMAYSLGGVIGALLYGTVGHNTHPRGAFAFGIWGVALGLGAFALWPSTPVMVTAAVISGALMGPMNPVVNLTLQRRTSPNMLGRATGIVIALAYGAYPIGAVTVGVLAEQSGVVPTLAASAGLTAVVALIASVAPSLRRLDEEPLAEASAVSV